MRAFAPDQTGLAVGVTEHHEILAEEAHFFRFLNENGGYESSRDDFGGALDRIYTASQNIVRGLPGHTIQPLAPADTARFQKDLVQPLITDCQKRIPNGDAILTAYRAEATRIRAQP